MRVLVRVYVWRREEMCLKKGEREGKPTGECSGEAFVLVGHSVAALNQEKELAES